MGKLTRNKVVNLSILGFTTTLVGIEAMILTGLIVAIGLYFLYKFAKKPIVNISIS